MKHLKYKQLRIQQNREDSATSIIYSDYEILMQRRHVISW